MEDEPTLLIASRIDLIIVGLYMVVMVGIGVLASRFNKSDGDFFRGGSVMPWWLAGVSLMMSVFSVYTFTGAASLTYRAPGVAFTSYLTNGLGYLFGYLFLASKWRRTRSTTVFSYLTERFGLGTNQVYSWTMVLAVFFQSGIMLLALAKFTSVAMGYDLNQMIIICGVIIAVYCLIGGLWAVVITDTLQFMVLFPCAIVAACLGLYSMGGPGVFMTELIDAYQINVSGTFIAGGSWSFSVQFMCAAIVGSIFASTSGAAAQRYFSVKNEHEARKVGLLVFVLLTLAPMIWLIPPFAARYLDMDGELAMIANALNMTAAEESAYVVFCLKFLPVGAMGVMLAAMFAATMSTISSNFNVYAGVLTKDIIGQIFLKNASERTLLLIGRIVTVFQGGIVITLAILMSQHEGGVFQLMLDFSGIIIMPAGIPIVLGLFYRRTTSWAAMASYLTGLGLGIITLFVLPENYDFDLFGVSLLSNPVTYEQRIFVFGGISALVFFIPGLFIRSKGSYKQRLDKFFVKMETPVHPDETPSSAVSDLLSYRITGWTTVIMGAPVMLLALLPNLTTSGRWINFIIGLMMCALGAAVLFMSKKLRHPE